MRTVTWAPLRYQIKKRTHTAARLRGHALQATGRLPEIANIYAAGSPKAGSQWMRALFDHPIVRSHSGLLTLPQLDYRTGRPLPLGTFVPGVYTDYPTYQQLSRRGNHRTVYMFRDPRDLMVSGYFSATISHPDTHFAEVEQFRDELRAMPFDEGLLHLINYNVERLNEIVSWVGIEDPTVATFKLEDVKTQPEIVVPAMLTHVGVNLDADELATVLSDVSRGSLQAADLAKRAEGAESHYRVDAKPTRELIKPMHIEAIERIVPGLIRNLGYEEY